MNKPTIAKTALALALGICRRPAAASTNLINVNGSFRGSQRQSRRSAARQQHPWQVFK